MKFLLFFLLFVFQVQAQEVLFEGYVYDNKTKKPIPYVNLSFLNTLKGASTDEDGHFYLNVPKPFLEKKIHISSLGYNDTIVNAKMLYKAKKMHMIEESFELDEVIVTEKLDHTDVLNPISSYSLTSGFSSSVTPWVLGVYFPNIGAQKKYVEKITVFVNKNKSFKNKTSKFRIRVYDVDPKTRKPKDDLLRESIILEHDVKKEFVAIDLSKYRIKIPKEGIYVGLEWLFVEGNRYVKTTVNSLANKNEVEDRFAPVFSGVYTKNQNYRVMVYGMGEWVDFKVRSRNNVENFIPAVSLKIKKK